MDASIFSCSSDLRIVWSGISSSCCGRLTFGDELFRLVLALRDCWPLILPVDRFTGSETASMSSVIDEEACLDVLSDGNGSSESCDTIRIGLRSWFDCLWAGSLMSTLVAYDLLIACLDEEAITFRPAKYVLVSFQ